jgi:long-chain-fatty-acid--CoA ligase ACSBG
VRPTIFFSVPRIWEKIEEKMKAIAKDNGFLKT